MVGREKSCWGEGAPTNESLLTLASIEERLELA